MDEREPAAGEAQGNEGRSFPDEEQVNTDDEDEVNMPGPSGRGEEGEGEEGEEGEGGESQVADVGHHRYYYFGSSFSASNGLERRIPPTQPQFLELCRSELPKSEGGMAAYVKRLRRERDRTLALINEKVATLLSLREMLLNPPKRRSSCMNWHENFETYNIDQSLGVNNKMKYFVVVTDRQVYFIQSDEIRISPADGYSFDGTTLSRRLDLPSTSNSQRRGIDFGEGGFLMRHRSSTDSGPSSSGNSEGPSDVNVTGSGQAIPEGENSSERISPLKSSSSGQLRSTNAKGKKGKKTTSSQASTSNNQLESVPQDTLDSSTNNQSARGPRSSRGSSSSKKLARQSRSNQDSSTNNRLAKGSRSNRDSSPNKQLTRQFRSNQDSSTNDQLERQNKISRDKSTSNRLKRRSRKNQDSSTHNLNPTGTDTLSIPGPLNREAQFEAAGSSHSEHSYSMNPSVPGPSGINQNDLVAYTNNSETANVGSSGSISRTLLMGAPLIASPQVTNAIHSNQSFYSTATGNMYAGTSTGSDTVSSYGTENYSDSRVSYAHDNAQRSRFFLMPNQVYVDENVVYNAVPVYFGSDENYGMVSEYAGADGSSNASLNTYPAAASGVIGNSAGVQSFHPVNVYSQGDTSGGNTVQSHPSTPHAGYVPSNPVTYNNMQNNIQSYDSDLVNEYPHVSGHSYGYGPPYNSNNRVVYNSAVATLNPYVQDIHSTPNTVYGPTMAPQVQDVLGMNATHGGMHPFAPSGEAIAPPGNIYPHASGGMYNSMSNENNEVQLYIPNSWQNPSGHTVIYNSGYQAPGISTLDIQGHDPLFISHEEVVDGEPENLVSPEGNQHEGSARTRGFTKVPPQASDRQNDPTKTNSTEVNAAERKDTNETDARTSAAEAGSSKGGSAQTSTSRGGKTKISAHKRTSQSSDPEESSMQSSSEGRRNHRKGKFQASTSRERAPEATTPDRASHSVNREKKFQLEPSVGSTPESSITEGALSNIQRSITHVNASDRKEEKKGTQDTDSGIRTRSKTRELNRKEAEKSSLPAVGAATGVERKNLRSTTTRRASKTAVEASFSDARDRKRTKTSDLSEIPSNAGILRAEQGNKTRPPPEKGTLSQILTRAKIKLDTIQASWAGPSALTLESGPSALTLESGPSALTLESGPSALTLESGPSALTLESGPSALTLESGPSALTLESGPSALTLESGPSALTLESGPSALTLESGPSALTLESGPSALTFRVWPLSTNIRVWPLSTNIRVWPLSTNIRVWPLSTNIRVWPLSTNIRVWPLSTNIEVWPLSTNIRVWPLSTNIRVWPLSTNIRVWPLSTNIRTDFSEAVPGDRDLRATDKRKDLPGGAPTPGKNKARAAVASTETLEAMPSTSVQKRKWIPATTIFKPLTIRENEANTSFSVIKSSSRAIMIERTPSSTSTGSKLPKPVLMLHKQDEKKSDLGQRNENEATLMRILQVEQDLARYRNEYNNILKLLSVIDDYIIEAPLYIEETLTPQRY
ncbi:serine-rich adhesin for platelets-like [Macrobrachium rosenbergii]|uniref:serine-rich adhesin for platelets-like n=1 Tax=Macrobrachium rosenbergii TaxID=79674 RepID=UPI0034D66163